MWSRNQGISGVVTKMTANELLDIILIDLSSRSIESQKKGEIEEALIYASLYDRYIGIIDRETSKIRNQRRREKRLKAQQKESCNWRGLDCNYNDRCKKNA